METVPVMPVPPSRPPKPKTTFGSLVAAMLVGAVVTVWGLYSWGSHVDAERRVHAEQPTP